LSFSTYFGGSGNEHSTSVAVDGSFNIYIAGSTNSPNLPATGTFQSTLNGAQNLYIAKITPPLGSIVATLDYVTYLGGDGTDSPAGIKVDGAGDAFLAGTTSSTNFPTSIAKAYQTVPEAGSTGTSHVFVTELNPTATAPLLYSSYLSGNGTDVASGMTIDALGNVFVTGTTTSQDVASTIDQFPASTLPQALPYQDIPRSSIQFFMTKVNTTAAGFGSIAYSTYFGGENFETSTPIAVGGGIAVDSTGNVFFSGTTNFTYTGCAGCATGDFPILNAYQPCLDQAPPTVITNPAQCSPSSAETASDAFVAKLNPNAAQGQQLQWSTYVGGTATDSSTGVALDPGAANVYIVGTTNSTDIASSVTTLNTSASYQRCLDAPNVATGTACPNNLATNDAFVARLTNPTNTTGTAVNVALNYFSYLGGSGNEAGLAITVDSSSGALLTGWTQSTDFPVSPNPNSIQSTLNPTQDAFVARLNAAAVVGQTTIASWANYFGGSGITSGTGIVLDVNQNTYIAGETNSTSLAVSKPLASGTTNSGGYDAFVTQLGTAVSLSISGVLSSTTSGSFVPAGTAATFTYTITNNGPDLANNIVVTDNLSSAVTGVPVSFSSASSSSQSCGSVSSNGTISCPIPSLQSGSTATVVIAVIPTGNPDGSQATFNGGTVQVMGPGNIVLAQTSVPANMSDFSLQVAPANQSIPAAGATATYQVQLTPHPLYTTSVTLSCTGLPANSACIFVPTPVTLQSTSGASAVLSITTIARPVVTPASMILPRLFFGMGLMIPGLILTVGIGARRRRIGGLMLLCSVLALFVFLPACSHTNTQAPAAGTPAGNYTITVTASAGTGNAKSATIGLLVP
ncbi:MAG: SBBP repeat-containing protein, partial [Candidatus Sulfotelmatobacter sp.]